MYTRSKVWQTAIIDNISQSGFVNIITLGFPCVDFRLNLTGYGWKPETTDENLSVLYKGRYEVYYRKFGVSTWEHLNTVESERADYTDTVVYKDAFISAGILTEELYQIKIVAANGPEFGTWGGIIEGISSDGLFFSNLMIRGGQAISKEPMDNISVRERVSIGFTVLNIDVASNVVTNDIITGGKSQLSLSIYDSVNISEIFFINFYQGINVYDSATISESISVILARLNISRFEDILIEEAINGEDPTRLVFKLDHNYIAEYVSMAFITGFNIYTEAEVAEYTDFYFTSWSPFIYQEIAMSENFSALITIRPSVFDSIGHTEYAAALIDVVQFLKYDSIGALENFSCYLDVLQFLIYQGLALQESVNLYLGINISENDAISIEESISQYLTVLNLNNNETVTVAENANAESDLKNVLVYDEVSVIEDVSGELFLWLIVLNVYDAITHTESGDRAQGLLSLSLIDYITTSAVTGRTYWVQGSGDGVMSILRFDNSEIDLTGDMVPISSSMSYDNNDFQFGAYSAAFNGSSNYLLSDSGFRTIIRGDRACHIEFRIKPDATANNGAYVMSCVTTGSFNQEFVLRYNRSGDTESLSFWTVNDSGTIIVSLSGTLVSNQWNHVVIYVNSSYSAMFVNGSLKSTDTSITGWDAFHACNTAFGCKIAKATMTRSLYWKGKLDDVVFFLGDYYGLGNAAGVSTIPVAPNEFPYTDGAYLGFELLDLDVYDEDIITEDITAGII